MNKHLLMKINRTAFEIGENTIHDVYVSYLTKTGSIHVDIYRGGIEVGKDSTAPESMSSIMVDPQVILHTLLGLLNEKEVAA